MTESPESAGERIGRRETLAEQAAALVKEVGTLHVAVKALGKRASRNERTIVVLVLTLAVDIVLSVALGFVIANNYTTNARLDAVIGQEQFTRSEVFCPLYALFIGSYNPATRPEGPARDQYEQAFVTLREGSAKLECQGPPVPPRSDPPR